MRHEVLTSMSSLLPYQPNESPAMDIKGINASCVYKSRYNSILLTFHGNYIQGDLYFYFLRDFFLLESIEWRSSRNG